MKIKSTCHFVFSWPKFNNKQLPTSYTQVMLKLWKNCLGILYSFSSLSNRDMYTLKEGTLQFAQKWYFWSTTDKVSINIEFCMLELVQVPIYSLNWQIWFFGLYLTRMGIFVLKLKKWTFPLNSAHSNQSWYKISL